MRKFETFDTKDSFGFLDVHVLSSLKQLTQASAVELYHMRSEV